MSQNQTVAIIYGFAEGSYHGRALRKTLQQAGFTPTKDLRQADIIIAHSAGCYLVPDNTQAKAVLHIGYTYWPGRSLPNSLQALLALEYRRFGLVRWFCRCIVNDFYMLKFWQTIRMYRGWHNPGEYLDRQHAVRQIFIRNRDDTYCNAEALLERAGRKHTYISLPGTHNHIWDHPEPYVDLLQSVV